MEWTIDGYNIFVYNKRENMIPTVSFYGTHISRYLPKINGQI